jgi:Family of unknown function (DUF5989)
MGRVLAGEKGKQGNVIMEKASLIREFYGFMKVRKKYWLLPIMLMLCLMGLLIVFTESSVVAPFVYALF